MHCVLSDIHYQYQLNYESLEHYCIVALYFSLAVAVSHYQKEALVKSYAVWYQRFQRATELKQLQQLVETMNVKARLKRYLRLWQTCIFYYYTATDMN